VLLDIYRGGNDESTLGPNLVVDSNAFNDCKGSPGEPFINLIGVQRSRIKDNKFSNVNENSILINYIDRVRAYHFLTDNRIKSSGTIKSNDFVINQKNIIQ
jgi:poly(beta-D-mannuronate) lyase